MDSGLDSAHFSRQRPVLYLTTPPTAQEDQRKSREDGRSALVTAGRGSRSTLGPCDLHGRRTPFPRSRLAGLSRPVSHVPDWPQPLLCGSGQRVPGTVPLGPASLVTQGVDLGPRCPGHLTGDSVTDRMTQERAASLHPTRLNAGRKRGAEDTQPTKSSVSGPADSEVPCGPGPCGQGRRHRRQT